MWAQPGAVRCGSSAEQRSRGSRARIRNEQHHRLTLVLMAARLLSRAASGRGDKTTRRIINCSGCCLTNGIRGPLLLLPIQIRAPSCPPLGNLLLGSSALSSQIWPPLCWIPCRIVRLHGHRLWPLARSLTCLLGARPTGEFSYFHIYINNNNNEEHD